MMLNFPAAGGLNQPEDFWGQLIAQMRSPQGMPLSMTMPIQDPHAFWGVPKPPSQIGALMSPKTQNTAPGQAENAYSDWIPYSDYAGHWMINPKTGERKLVSLYDASSVQGG